jgi:hypothetical protein
MHRTLESHTPEPRLGFRFRGGKQSVATPHVARGWAHPAKDTSRSNLARPRPRILGFGCALRRGGVVRGEQLAHARSITHWRCLPLARVYDRVSPRHQPPLLRRSPPRRDGALPAAERGTARGRYRYIRSALACPHDTRTAPRVGARVDGHAPTHPGRCGVTGGEVDVSEA